MRATGALVLDGELTLDVRAPITPGTVLTIMSGASIKGNFHFMPERRVLNVGGHMFRVSYKGGAMTLTAERTLPKARSGNA
ncbi:hypothetical protein [Micromonospora profundi]|uniref:hypothetical protein n=1 Tax=Micromonospora TaxID=1873 RepID=UPI0033ACFD6C